MWDRLLFAANFYCNEHPQIVLIVMASIACMKVGGSEGT